MQVTATGQPLPAVLSSAAMNDPSGLLASVVCARLRGLKRRGSQNGKED